MTTLLIDDQLAEYLSITKQLKKLEERKDELRELILAQPEYKSERYTVKVTEYTSERIEPLKDIQNKSEKLFQALHKAGCIKEITSKRIKVSLNE